MNSHPAKKLIIERDFNAVQDSMMSAGLPLLCEDAQQALARIPGHRVQYTDLFEHSAAARIWRYLYGEGTFCHYRHATLCEMEIEPRLRVVDNELQNRLSSELLI